MKKVFWIVVLIILAILVGPKAYEYLFNSGKEVGESIGHELNKNMNNN
ncbi:TPA: hypothetical protein L3H12_002097 [Acinetobacter baumannii]|nr:hypothetical protein [Acinetobacter baumannii]HBN5965376.1 hypothetical protein [Acinetobacter baumannii]